MRLRLWRAVLAWSDEFERVISSIRIEGCEGGSSAESASAFTLACKSEKTLDKKCKKVIIINGLEVSYFSVFK
jgi:hypothetical protein